MHLLNLPAEPIPLHHIVVKLIPPRRRREFRARELGQRGEVKAVDDAAEDVECCGDGGGGEEDVVHFAFSLICSSGSFFLSFFLSFFWIKGK